MKKTIVGMLVLVLLATTALPVSAAGGPQGRNGARLATGASRSPFAMAGTITSLNPVALTVTVTIACGNKLVKPYIGQDLTLQTTETTRFLLRNPDGTATPITFADLLVGQDVSANGRFANEVWTAGRITVGALLSCLP